MRQLSYFQACPESVHVHWTVALKEDNRGVRQAGNGLARYKLYGWHPAGMNPPPERKKKSTMSLSDLIKALQADEPLHGDRPAVISIDESGFVEKVCIYCDDEENSVGPIFIEVN